MFGRFGPMELVLILAIALIVFGPKKLPEIGKAIGNALRNFRRHASSMADELENDGNTATKQPDTRTERPDDEAGAD